MSDKAKVRVSIDPALWAQAEFLCENRSAIMEQALQQAVLVAARDRFDRARRYDAEGKPDWAKHLRDRLHQLGLKEDEVRLYNQPFWMI